VLLLHHLELEENDHHVNRRYHSGDLRAAPEPQTNQNHRSGSDDEENSVPPTHTTTTLAVLSGLNTTYGSDYDSKRRLQSLAMAVLVREMAPVPSSPNAVSGPQPAACLAQSVPILMLLPVVA
jgi:hypothetical protein